MPVCLDPSRRFHLSLKSDEATPEAQRPRFSFQHLNGRRWMEVADIYDGINNASNGRAALDGIYSAIRKSLRGWENVTTTDPDIATEFGLAVNGKPVELPYDPAKLDLVLGVADAKELFEGIIATVRVSEADKGN